MITDTQQETLREVQAESHPRCVVCGQTNGRGLQLQFKMSEDGSVQARFECGAAYEGYPRILHGGVVSALLDGAMTNCLFAHGHPGLTAELNVRFRHPVRIGAAATVRAWIERRSPPLHVLRAELTQEGRLRATARGKFMERGRSTTGGS